jgi:WD40 repeat protein
MAGSRYVYHIARWDGANWYPLGSGMNGAVTALLVLSNGDLLVGGYFTTAGGVAANRIAVWDGTTWSPLGAGMTGTTVQKSVNTLALQSDGSIFAAGTFSSAGDLPANNVARWDGTSWSPLLSGTNNTVYSLAILPDTTLIAGGKFTIAGGKGSANLAHWTQPIPPRVTTQPLSVGICPAERTASFSVTAGDADSLTYAWRKDSVLIDILANPSADKPILVLTNILPADAGQYDCIVSDACESVVSDGATFVICSGEYNCDGGVDGADVAAFFSDWEVANPAADLNADGGIDFADVAFFFAAWEAGC